MSKIFWALSDPQGTGSLSLGTDYNRARFKEFLKKNPGIRLKIDPYTPESKNQRGFFEGGVIPFIACFQENIDHNDREHLQRIRDWLMIEFNGGLMTLGGKCIKVPKSSKGELNRGLLERIMDWAGEQGYPIELLNPEEYKDWRDRIRPNEGPVGYIDYLESIGKLKK